MDVFGRCLGLPGGTRTPDPQLRRLVLYPVELRAASPARLVGAAGFELATYWSQTSCATRLRYAPNERDCTQRSPRARGSACRLPGALPQRRWYWVAPNSTSRSASVRIGLRSAASTSTPRCTA